ncbi:glycosyltransferase [candidate division NPL-UPA2 bacterium]|nr:glycosyltransferase [candidate division NPL-UPA2 bacterium]
MRIGMVSTYPPIECGIATYTKYLVEALRRVNNEVYIVSQFGGRGERVYSAFHANDPDLADRVFQMMAQFTPDVVHIQHEYGLFGKPRGMNVIPLVYRFKLAKIPVVITLHSVYEVLSREEKIILEALIRTADAVIVHEEYQKEVILDQIGSFDNIRVIPHGSREIELIPKAKERIGLRGEEKVILLCGYFRETKGLHRIVRLFPCLAERVKEAVLVIAGKTRQQEYSEYRDEFFQLVNSSPVLDRIKVLRGQFPQKTFDTILAAADVIPMPYRKGSQSGILAHCLALGRPVVVSPEVRALRETVARAQCGLIAKDDDEFVEHIVKILSDDALRDELSRNARDYVRRTISWQIIAKETINIYHKVVSVPYGKARYIHL